MLKIGFHRKKMESVNFAVYILVLLVILSSKTVYFGIINMQKTLSLSLFSLFIYNLIKYRKLYIKKFSFIILVIFIILLVIVSLFYLGDIFFEFRSYIGAIVHFVEVLLIGLLVVNTIEKSEFIRSYVHILFIISCVSLLFFFLSIYDKSGALEMSSIYYSRNSRYIALPWYTFGWQEIMYNGYEYNYVFGRNAGPWWEPGAFQGFIFIGVFMLLNYKEFFNRKALLLIVFSITLLTTQSTTAYIIVLVSLIAYSKDYLECLFGGNKLLEKKRTTPIYIYSVVPIFVVVIAYLIVTTGNISDKFAYSNGSYISRMNDLRGTMELIWYNPVAGVGLGRTAMALQTVKLNTLNATTLLTLAMYFGLPFMIYYYYRFLKGCDSLFQPDSPMKKGVLYISFTFILMSETLYLLPIYSVFLFSTAKWGRSRPFIENN